MHLCDEVVKINKDQIFYPKNIKIELNSNSWYEPFKKLVNLSKITLTMNATK